MAELQQYSLRNMPIAGRSALSPVRVGNGVFNDAWFSTDGALVTQPWLQAIALEGRCFQVDVGALITGIASGSATVPELAEPECIISVPTGAVIMPYYVHISSNAPDDVADHNLFNVIVGWDRGKAYDGTGTHATEIAYNLRGDNPRATVCTCTSAHTDDITSIPVTLVELARYDTHIDVASAIALGQITVELKYEPKVVPYLVGPCMLVLMAGGTKPLASWAQVQWAEFTKAELGF